MPPAHLKLHVDLGDDFLAQLNAVIEEEFKVASEKWGYVPTNKEKANIREHAVKQLVFRINSVSSNQWSPGPAVQFNMAGPKKEISVPSGESAASSYKLVRSRDGWVVDQDRGEDSVPLNAFPEVFKNEVFNWARTAIFYSVGSYKV